MNEEKTTYERTIPLELLEVWNRYRRRGDGELLSVELGYSRPVIDRALKHGYVKTNGLTEKISKFFSDRLAKERESAKQLNERFDQNENLPTPAENLHTT